MIFKKKAAAPASVSEAIAPFRAVQENLSTVMQAHIERKSIADTRIKDAQAYAKGVQEAETAAQRVADAELVQAEKIIAALGSILGDPSQETLQAEQASAHT